MDKDTLRAVLVALAEAGFVVMPKEPSKEMLDAMRSELTAALSTYTGESGPFAELEDEAERNVYRVAIEWVLWNEYGVKNG